MITTPCYTWRYRSTPATPIRHSTLPLELRSVSTIRLLVALLVLALSSAGCGTVARAGDDSDARRRGPARRRRAAVDRRDHWSARGRDQFRRWRRCAGDRTHACRRRSTHLRGVGQATRAHARGRSDRRQRRQPRGAPARPTGGSRPCGRPVFRATDHTETLTFGGEHDEQPQTSEHDDHGDDHDERPADGRPVDPHVWTDPTRMADVVRALGERIGELSRTTRPPAVLTTTPRSWNASMGGSHNDSKPSPTNGAPWSPTTRR